MAHAVLGASSSERWMKCPGSIRMSAGRSSTESIYAITGTAAHWVASTCLAGNRQPIEFLDRYIDVELQAPIIERSSEGHIVHHKAAGAIEKILCDEEMVEGVQLYLDHCLEVSDMGFDPNVLTFIEEKIDLHDFDPDFPEPMFGTTDFGCYRPRDKTLVIDDLKYGQGVVVEAGKPQTRYYGLGLLLHPKVRELPVERVELNIVQPRAYHPGGPIRGEALTVDELMEWGETELMPAARRTLEPDAPLVPGDHCTFCPAAGDCPALRRLALETAMVQFSDLDAMPLPGAAPPPVESLTGEQVARLLELSEPIMVFLRSMRERAFRDLNEDPESIPNWKIVGRKGRRRWLHETQEETALDLIFDLGIPEGQLWQRPKIKSPAQIEEVIKGMYPPRHPAKRTLNKQLHKYFETPVTGTTLAKLTDDRPALLGVDLSTFEVLE